MAPMVTTYTITSVNTTEGTFSLTTKVVESVESALAHLREMGRLYDSEPFYDTHAGWRWTWSGKNDHGTYNDTVRIV